MENKKLGIIILAVCAILVFLLFTFNSAIKSSTEASCSCTEMENGGICPHEKATPWQMYTGLFVIGALAALAVYLVFFEKGQKEIMSVLEKQKHLQIEDEKFSILLKGLNADEQKIMNAIKEQDGITQQTLRLRVDMHKSKLSILVDGLEKKGLIKKVPKGKTNQIFIKIRL